MAYSAFCKIPSIAPKVQEALTALTLEHLISAKNMLSAKPSTGRTFFPIYIKQFRFPKSKKKRVRKKFAKNPANYRITRGVMVHGTHFIPFCSIKRKNYSIVNEDLINHREHGGF